MIITIILINQIITRTEKSMLIHIDMYSAAHKNLRTFTLWNNFLKQNFLKLNFVHKMNLIFI